MRFAVADQAAGLPGTSYPTAGSHTARAAHGLRTLCAAIGLALFSSACDSGSSGNNAPVPMVSGAAIYVDENANGICDAGDSLILRFNQGVNGQNLSADNFDLPVPGDSLGSGVNIAPGTDAASLKIVLGSGPAIKTRQRFSEGVATANASSGVDISANAAAGVILGTSTNLSAVPMGGVDLVPGFLEFAALSGAPVTVSSSAGADLNADGKRDAILGVFGAGNRVYYGDGSGGLSDSGQSLGTAATRDLALGDLDGNGSVDFVAANDFGQPNRIWLNNAAGVFSPTPQNLGSGPTLSVDLADIDLDGDLDFAAGNIGINSIWSNDSTAGFTPLNQGISLAGFQTGVLLFGDLDGDGDPDLVEGNRGSQSDRVYFNDRSGFFDDSGQSLGSASATDLLLVDFDRDGDLDLFQGNGNAANQLFNNNGAGLFTKSEQPIGRPGTRSLAAVDLDADGAMDVVEAAQDGQSSVAWMNTGEGSFAAEPIDLGGREAVSLDVGDLDQDGDADALLWDEFGQGRVFLGSLSGTWGQANLTLEGGVGPTMDTTDLLIADWNRDGLPDFAEARTNGLPNRIYFGTGAGAFVDSGQELGLHFTTDLASADIDRDGDWDLIAANDVLQPGRVFINTGDGTLFDSENLLGVSSTAAIAAGDLNGDGFADVFEANYEAADHVFFSTGLGSFAIPMQELGTSASFAAGLGDLDLDGDLDIVVGCEGEDLVWSNQGLGQFVLAENLPGSEGTSTRALALSDLDRDGDLDAVFGDDSTGGRVYLREGPAARYGSPTQLDPGSTVDVVPFDLDGDGDRDLLLANRAGPNRILLAEGDGTFPTSFLLPGSLSTTGVAIADLDLDGDNDALEAAVGADLRLFLNR